LTQLERLKAQLADTPSSERMMRRLSEVVAEKIDEMRRFATTSNR